MPDQPDQSRLFCGAEMHGLWINDSDTTRSLEEVGTLVAKRSRRFVCFFEANLFSRALLDGEVRAVINQAALVYPDGIAPSLATRFCFGRKFYRVSGPGFMLEACRYGVARNWRHFFLGGSEGVAEHLAQLLRQQIPGIQIVGTYCPPFRPLTEEEEADVKEKIESAHTDLLWVGLGGPKQEFWMAAHQDKIDVPVMLGVGAAFDFHARTRPWAPYLVRRVGLEWMWRMFSDVRKTFFRNLRCVSHIALVLSKDFCRHELMRIPRATVRNRPPEEQP